MEQQRKKCYVTVNVTCKNDYKNVRNVHNMLEKHQSRTTELDSQRSQRVLPLLSRLDTRTTQPLL
jgi:hypothetical protein